MSRTSPKVALFGHVTLDLIDGVERLGGAVSYAAMACRRLGIEAHVVTSAPRSWPLLGELAENAASVEVQPSPEVTTFVLRYGAGGRRLWLRARAACLRLGPETGPWDLAYVAPVANEISVDLIRRLRARTLVVGLQGFLRTTEPCGRVVPALDEGVFSLPPHAVVVFSEEDHPDADALAARLAAAPRRVAVTRGARGVTLYHGAGHEDQSAVPAREEDPTGAGDVFGLVLGLELLGGRSFVDAAAAAQRAAARAVEGPGVGRLGLGPASASWSERPSAHGT